MDEWEPPSRPTSGMRSGTGRPTAGPAGVGRVSNMVCGVRYKSRSLAGPILSCENPQLLRSGESALSTGKPVRWPAQPINKPRRAGRPPGLADNLGAHGAFSSHRPGEAARHQALTPQTPAWPPPGSPDPGAAVSRLTDPADACAVGRQAAAPLHTQLSSPTTPPFTKNKSFLESDAESQDTHLIPDGNQTG